MTLILREKKYFLKWFVWIRRCIWVDFI